MKSKNRQKTLPNDIRQICDFIPKLHLAMCVEFNVEYVASIMSIADFLISHDRYLSACQIYNLRLCLAVIYVHTSGALVAIPFIYSFVPHFTHSMCA